MISRISARSRNMSSSVKRASGNPFKTIPRAQARKIARAAAELVTKVDTVSDEMPTRESHDEVLRKTKHDVKARWEREPTKFRRDARARDIARRQNRADKYGISPVTPSWLGIQVQSMMFADQMDSKKAIIADAYEALRGQIRGCRYAWEVERERRFIAGIVDQYEAMPSERFPTGVSLTEYKSKASSSAF